MEIKSTVFLSVLALVSVTDSLGDVLYCFNQPCPPEAEACDRDFVIVNSTTAEVKIHCLNGNGDILKTYPTYKAVKLRKLPVDNAPEEDDYASEIAEN